MAFNNLGPLISLAPGQSFYWWYTLGGDHGTQFASADINRNFSHALVMDLK